MTRTITSGVAALVALSVWWATAPAALATGWSIERMPTLAGARQITVTDLSCSSARACTAVGYYDSSVGPRPPGFVALVERWDGARWSIQPDAAPAGASSTLGAVSCSSQTVCVAVGQSGITVLVEGWTGVGWATQPVAPAAFLGGSVSGLRAVSCSNPRACVAIGSYSPLGINSTDAFLGNDLMGRWNGTSWQLQGVSPLPDTRGLSCPSVTTCVAVGTGLTAPHTSTPLAAGWNGERWTLQRPARPGAAGGSLVDVSCTGRKACTAVGSHLAADHHGDEHQQPLVERWNGARWSVMHTPSPNRAADSMLADVSCTSSTACTAVGTYYHPQAVPFVERWNGIRWSLQRPAIPVHSANIALSNVSCASKTYCVALGSYTGPAGGTDFPFSERWRAPN